MFLDLATSYKKKLCVPTDLEKMTESLSHWMGASEFEILKAQVLNKVQGRCVDKEFRSEHDGAGEVWCVWEISENGVTSFLMFTGYYQSCQGYEGDDVFEVERITCLGKEWVMKQPIERSIFAELVKIPKRPLPFSVFGFESKSWMKQLRKDYDDPDIGWISDELVLLDVRLIERCCSYDSSGRDNACGCDTPWSIIVSSEPDGRRFTKVTGWGNWMYGTHFKDAFEVELQDVEFIEWRREQDNVRRSSAKYAKRHL